MNRAENNKEKQISDIVSVVKLSSLLFVGIILCKYIFIEDMVFADFAQSYYALVAIILPLFVLVLIYFMWTFSSKNKLKQKHGKIIANIETMAFIILFTIVIYMCGAYESEYKFLYLFIIITTTIQSGMQKGVTVSFISSVIILAMDLIMVPGDINVYFENDLILAGIFVLTAWPLGFYVKIESEHIKQLEDQVNIDGLTGVYNHRYFHDELRKKIMQGKMEHKPVSMIFIDIDYFKHYNDLYGHQKGDTILREMATVIKENVDLDNIVARYGGEEFAIILPNTREDIAMRIAENLRAKIENTYFEGEENQPNGKITASFGISVYPDKAKDDMDLIKSADDALYRAKFFNKNRVEAYTSILDDIKQNISDEKDIELVASIKTLISVINAKDRYTYGHVERVVIYSRLLADQLKLSEKEKATLIYGAYMHDIGKINIAKDILVKKMKLTNDEWGELKQHPNNGVEIIKPVESLKDVIPLIQFHHERFDGKGYPHNLKGEDIPYLARVLTVVDSFDAMTSNRPYNKRKTYEEGVEELRKCSGAQFDPDIVEAFIKVITSKTGQICIGKIEAGSEAAVDSISTLTYDEYNLKL